MFNTHSISNRSSSTLGSIAVLTALGTFTNQINYDSEYYVSDFADNGSIVNRKEPMTFSSIVEVKSESIENMLLQVYERMAKDSRPLEPDLAQILSDNIIDLF